MDGDGRSTQLIEKKEEAEASDLKVKEVVVGLIEEATEDKAKQTETKVKMGLK